MCFFSILICIHIQIFSASWYMEVESLKVFSLEEKLDNRDSIEESTCFIIDGGWFDSLCMYLISFLGLEKGF